MIWFPPDYGEMPLEYRAGLEPGRLYHKGQDVVNLQVQAGDHLFVDRLSYNFRKPQRGEIVVFATAGIPEEQREKFRIPGDQFYIKRLVGLEVRRSRWPKITRRLGHRNSAAGVCRSDISW